MCLGRVLGLARSEVTARVRLAMNVIEDGQRLMQWALSIPRVTVANWWVLGEVGVEVLVEARGEVAADASSSIVLILIFLF